MIKIQFKPQGQTTKRCRRGSKATRLRDAAAGKIQSYDMDKSLQRRNWSRPGTRARTFF